LTRNTGGSSSAATIIRGQDGRPDRVFECEGRVVTIGRSAENHLRSTNLNSSRHHCEVHDSKEGFELIDKDSRTARSVNGRRRDPQVLQAGDKVEIGTTVLYFERLPEDVAKERRGKETLDLSTGLFAPFRRPSGAFGRAEMNMETGRITSPRRPPLIGATDAPTASAGHPAAGDAGGARRASDPGGSGARRRGDGRRDGAETVPAFEQLDGARSRRAGRASSAAS